MRSCNRTTRGYSAGFLMLALAIVGLAGCNSPVNPYLQFDGRPAVASEVQDYHPDRRTAARQPKVGFDSQLMSVTEVGDNLLFDSPPPALRHSADSTFPERGRSSSKSR